MLTSSEILSFLTEHKNFILQNYHCREIGLFGSFARNEQTDQSDIDILVEYLPDTPNLYEVEISLKDFLKQNFNRKIDICSKKWINPIFKPLILNETLYA